MNYTPLRTSWHNSLKCSKGAAESGPHRQTKFWIADWAWEHSVDFDTEVVFSNNERADIFFRQWGVAFEVLHTETKKRFLEKTYPVPTVPVSTSFSRERVCAMLDDLSNTKGGGAAYYVRKYFEEFK